MTADEDSEDPPDTRREPVGAPVVRGDPEIAGERADHAATFDPDDSESLAQAEEVVREFASGVRGRADNLLVLKGAAACAAVVRGTGSYSAAAAQIGEPVTVQFLRTWARVHDLPISVRRHIAKGDIQVSAASQIARLTGNARYLLAWAVIDHGLSVEQVREIVGWVSSGEPIEAVLSEKGIDIGTIEVRLESDIYRELRRVASDREDGIDGVVHEALQDRFSSNSEGR